MKGKRFVEKSWIPKKRNKKIDIEIEIKSDRERKRERNKIKEDTKFLGYNGKQWLQTGGCMGVWCKGMAKGKKEEELKAKKDQKINSLWENKFNETLPTT